jgi:hypothetical protein
MAHDVFISYARENKAVADALCAKLEAKQIRCWIAPRDVQPGVPYGEAIVEGIQGSQVFVLVFSAYANGSKYVMREVEAAVDHELTVVPFRIEDIQPAPNLSFFIKSIHWLDALTLPLEKHLDNLTVRVEVHLGRRRAAESARAIEPAPRSRRPSVLICAATCLILLALGLALWFARDSFWTPAGNFVKSPQVKDVPRKVTRKFITPVITLEKIAEDLKAAQDPKKRRYITLTHLWNDSSVDLELLKEWQDSLTRFGKTLGKDVSVTWSPVDEAKTLYAADWPYPKGTYSWERISGSNPYAVTYQESGEKRLLETASRVGDLSDTLLPWVRADWFLRKTFKMHDDNSIRELLERWQQRPVRLSTATADLGLTDPPQLAADILRQVRLQKIGLAPLAIDGQISRATWEEQEAGVSPFQEATRLLGLGTPLID